MNETVRDLIEIVRKEIDLYRELIEHSRSKTRLLMNGSLDAVLESNKAEDTYSIKLRLLEEEFARISLDLCERIGISRKEFSLSRLARALEPPLALEIRSQSKVFLGLVRRLQTANQRNQKLIESSLDYSRGWLDFISNATSSYQGTGLLRPHKLVQTTLSRHA